MKVEKLIGFKPYSTFSDVKNASILGHFTHRITITHADLSTVTTDDDLAHTLNPQLFKDSGGTARGVLKGHYITDVVAYVKTGFTGVASQSAITTTIGITGNTNKFINAKSIATSDTWHAFASDGDGTTFGFVPTGTGAYAAIGVDINATVGSDSNQSLSDTTAGELQLFMSLTDMNELVTEGGWQDIKL